MEHDGAGPGAVPPRLVDVGWLRAHLHDPGVVVVEVDEDAGSYHQGHVPGAGALAWLDDLHEPDRRGVLSQQRLEGLLGLRGISPDTHVVLYGGADNLFAAYAYWVLRYHRHRAVSLLDGGRRAWVAQGGPLVAQSPARSAVVYRGAGVDEQLRVSREALLARYVGSPDGTAVLDCRDGAEFAGRPDSVMDLPLMRHRLGGHVPGARNVPGRELLDGRTGRFKPVAELRRCFAAHELLPEADIAVYCDVAVQSSLTWFVLHELLDYPQVRNYDGGWAEYGSLVGAPVERREHVRGEQLRGARQHPRPGPEPAQW